MTIPVTSGLPQGQPTGNDADPDSAVTTGSPLPLSASVLRMSVPEGAVIPSSLVTTLDEAYLFHLLARDSQQVVAPGKSLLSVLSGLNRRVTHPPESTTEKSVRKTMHRAFWDQVMHARKFCCTGSVLTLFQISQALETLSLLPPSQISRLKGLYKDLHEALAPLFPPTHPTLVPFSLPLPPTTSPLLSAVSNLHDVLVALRQRCAPVRDVSIDEILHQIDHRSPSASTGELAELIVSTTRSVLELSVDMRNDYSDAVLTTVSEQELTDMVATIAETQERSLVLQLWKSKETMREAWLYWMGGFQPGGPTRHVQQNQLWILKLIESLGKPHAVASQLVGSSRLRGIVDDSGRSDPDAGGERDLESLNVLPPQFLFSGPTLFRLQNYLQALTIAASLKSLVPDPRTTTKFSPPLQPQTDDPAFSAGWTFIKRVWTLLESEIEENYTGLSKTKIINLADEVVMTHRRALPPGVTVLDARLEQRLRDTVDRILRADDPVFVLLQKRLLVALSTTLLDIPVVEDVSPRMQSGRLRRHKGFPSPPLQGLQKEITITAKGFEDPIIIKQYSIAASTLRRSIEWVERVWNDTMPS